MIFKSLTDFENYRSSSNIIPPEGSNSFYNINDGTINILCKNESEENIEFDLYTDEGSVITGDGNFFVDKLSDNINNRPYKKMTVIENTKLIISQAMTVRGILSIHGSVEMLENSELIVCDGGSVIFYTDSNFIINDNIKISVDSKSSLKIYGTIDVVLGMVDYIIRNRGVFVDSAAIINVGEINIEGRAYSLTDYESSLRDKIISKDSQGEYNDALCKLGYNWIGGSSSDINHILNLSLLWGKSILGDFKLSILGFPIEKMQDRQIINQFIINDNTTLYIQEEYNDKRYVRPELYIGKVIGDNGNPGIVYCNGTIICDGMNSCITLDRGGVLIVNGSLILKNDAYINSTYNDDIPVLFINGTMIIDNIEQIKSLESYNIKFGENGKLVILNNYPTRKILFSTPNGILKSDLYRIFKNTLNKVEYHIKENTGIAIDQYYEYFNKDMINWYDDKRIEKAIHDGLIIWDNGFIQLNHSIIPWINLDNNLYDVCKIFKYDSSSKEDILQEVVNRLKYAGCNNIIFRLVKDQEVVDITLHLDGIKMNNIINKALSNKYTLNVSNPGFLYMKNNINNYDMNNIINKDSISIEVSNGDNEIDLSF